MSYTIIHFFTSVRREELTLYTNKLYVKHNENHITVPATVHHTNNWYMTNYVSFVLNRGYIRQTQMKTEFI